MLPHQIDSNEVDETQVLVLDLSQWSAGRLASNPSKIGNDYILNRGKRIKSGAIVIIQSSQLGAHLFSHRIIQVLDVALGLQRLRT